MQAAPWATGKASSLVACCAAVHEAWSASPCPLGQAHLVARYWAAASANFAAPTQHGHVSEAERLVLELEAVASWCSVSEAPAGAGRLPAARQASTWPLRKVAAHTAGVFPDVAVDSVLHTVSGAPGPGPDGIPMEQWRWFTAQLALLTPIVVAVFTAVGHLRSPPWLAARRDVPLAAGHSGRPWATWAP